MPLDRFVLILVIVLAAAGATVWLGVVLAASFPLNPAAPLVPAIPVALVLYVLARLIGQRLRDREDGHYDRIER